MMKDIEKEENLSLKVYKASAGSGKTYTLAKNFINLLIANPDDYERILAVTFTNKATAEMKERIMFNLFLLAYEHKQEPLKSKRASLMKAHVVDNRTSADSSDADVERRITQRCNKALILLLNDYSQFSISTIDSFVQKVIRAFAFEAGLNASYTVELDKTLILKNAIDEMMLSLQNNRDLQAWLIHYIEDNMEEGSSWRIESTLMKLVKIYLVETDFKGYNINRDDIKRYRDKLNDIIKETQEGLKREFDNMNEFLARNALDKTFFKDGAKNSTFKLLNNAYDLDAFIGFLKNYHHRFISKDGLQNEVVSPKADIDKSAGFVEICMRVVDLFYDYMSATCVKKDLYVVGILGDIQQHIEAIMQRENVMPISDTSVLLQKLIDGSDVPFIYEKIGSRYKNIMIDEFQDTSKVQWDNFYPLLKNSVDSREECLVVGDVKQAIYRWRNSDWKLLAETINEAFAGFVSETVLDYNYRSLSNVVTFNNYIFAPDRCAGCLSMPQRLQGVINNFTNHDDTSITDIYKTSVQNLPSGKKPSEGFVRAYIYNKEKKPQYVRGAHDGQSEDKSATLSIEEELARHIRELHDDKGYAYSDMCILVRKHKKVSAFIGALLDYGIPFVSSDSLYICSSEAVKVIIAHYKLMLNSHDEIALAKIMSICCGMDCTSGVEMSEWKAMCEQEKMKVLALRGYDLVLMTERIVSRLPETLVEDQFIYVEAFLDLARRFCEKAHVNLCDFVDYLDEKGEQLVIIAPDNQNAVTIMTIHKSKGLEFRCVFMPYASLDLLESSKRDNYIWVDMPAPFDVVSPIPLSYNKSLLLTHARELYKSEVLLRAIDTLNILYVAFTRAVDVLVIWCEDSAFSNNIVQVGYLLRELLKDVAKVNKDMIQTEEDERVVFTLGELPVCAKRADTSEHETVMIGRYKPFPWINNIRVNNEGDKERSKSRNGMINYGNVMHSIMERVRTVDDIDRAVAKAVYSGELREKDRERVTNDLQTKIASDALSKSWFDGSMQRVFIERTIMSEGRDYRPDRVMIDKENKTIVVDYKFGKQHSPKYVSQVRGYMQLLSQVGHDIRCGYLWYVEENKIERVEWSAE